MAHLKIKKRDPIIYNVIFFLFLSLIFMYIQHGYRNHLSVLSEVYARKAFELFWHQGLVVLFASIVIWRQSKLSLYGYLISVYLIGFKVVQDSFIEFNKTIIILLFIYVVISYLFYQLLKQHLSLACLNPNYEKRDLFDPLLKKIKCKVSSNNTEVYGVLTNWDNEGCFIKIDLPKKKIKKVEVEVFFHDRVFVQRGEVVAATLNRDGVGVKFNQSIKNLRLFNWEEFIEIVHELGYKPDRLI